MTGQVPTKLRLVRCPKCRRVLPELPNVPVYQCGGCGTVLQAKKSKVAPEDAETRVTESVTVNKNEPENISSEKEAQNFSQMEMLPSTGHHPVETNCESNQNETQICNREHSIDDESPHKISKKLMHLGNKESTPDVDEDKLITRDAESSTGYYKELMHHGSVESTPDIEDECVSNDADSLNGFSKELVCNGNFESSPETDKDECVSNDAKSSTEFSEELVKHGNVETSPEIDKDECLSKQIDNGDEKENDHCKEKRHRFVSFSGELVYLTELNHLQHEEAKEIKQRDSLTVVETNFKSNEYFRNRTMSGNSPEDEVFNESVLNNDRLSPPSDDQEQSHDRASLYNLERLSSINTVDNIAALRDMPESPMTRSYYGFYGSGSSCDGTDDPFPDRSFHLSKRNFEEREITNDKSLVRNDEVSNKIRDNPEMQGQNGNFSSSSSGKKQSAHPGLPLYGLETETIRYQPRVLLYPRDHEFSYLNGNYSNDEMSTNSHLLNKREYLEVEKMELLKKVHELQDQLNITCISAEKQNGNFPRPAENNAHPYHFVYNQEFGRYHEGRSGSHKSKNEVDHACLQYPSLPHGDFPLHNHDAKSNTSNKRTNHSNAIKNRAERLYLGKKHALPIAGGAPFLLCYGCSEVLQIPADFLLFKRRYHKLKCASCSVILKFSLLNRTHIAIYIDHSTKDLSQIEPVPVDDYKPSFCKSFSTEEAPSSVEPQFDYLKRNLSEKNKFSSNKGSIFTNFVKTLGSRSSSRRSKTESSTSEVEVTASANLPLHRLMGYHSATYLLKPDAQF